MCSEVAGAGGAGTSILLWTSNRAAAAHVENEAEDPSPAPTGSVARALKLMDGLQKISQKFRKKTGRKPHRW
jgi:hypothetical protein